jgi:hypothetical protein
MVKERAAMNSDQRLDLDDEKRPGPNMYTNVDIGTAVFRFINGLSRFYPVQCRCNPGARPMFGRCAP